MDSAITPYRIAFFLIDGFALLSYSAAVEPLRAANQLNDVQLFDICHITTDGKGATSSSGAFIAADHIAGQESKIDLLLVVAGGDPMRFDDKRIYRWLQNLAVKKCWLGGVSGGPVVLVKAGLMTGRRFTVHWEHAPALGEVDSDLLLERSLYVFDRDRVTCAGGTAAIDMMHALITSLHGGDFARQVSDWFMHTDIRPSFGPQRAGLVERYGTTNPVIIQTLEMMENHLGDVLSLDQLAALSSISSRQLNRLFNDRIGKSTMEFYRDLRLAKAENLIQQSTLSLTEIALATGFANSAHFSRAFKTRYQKKPSDLRF